MYSASAFPDPLICLNENRSESGCSRATYRGAEVIHTHTGGMKGGGSLLPLHSGFPRLPRCHSRRDKSTRCRQLCHTDGQMAWQGDGENELTCPQVPLTAYPSTLPLSSTQSSASCLTGQTTGKIK